MPREKAPKELVPLVLARPRVGSKWQDKEGNIVEILTHTWFHGVNLSNDEIDVSLEDFYKKYKPVMENKE